MFTHFHADNVSEAGADYPSTCRYVRLQHVLQIGKRLNCSHAKTRRTQTPRYLVTNQPATELSTQRTSNSTRTAATRAKRLLLLHKNDNLKFRLKTSKVERFVRMQHGWDGALSLADWRVAVVDAGAPLPCRPERPSSRPPKGTTPLLCLRYVAQNYYRDASNAAEELHMRYIFSNNILHRCVCRVLSQCNAMA